MNAVITVTGESNPIFPGIIPDPWTLTNNLIIGETGVGTLSIDNGGVVTNYEGYLGYDNGSIGVATISGGGSQWNNNYSSLYVGYYGEGTLHIDDGGVVNNYEGYLGYHPGSTGTATVSGDGSQWKNNSNNNLHVGFGGVGTLEIENGGYVSNRIGFLGYEAGSAGAVTIEGVGSRWNNSFTLHVGYLGDGMLTITNGGVVSSNGGYIGNDAGSSGTAAVIGAGSQWNMTSDLYVGYLGDGTLNIDNGALLSSGNVSVGTKAGSSGTFTISGDGSRWNGTGSLRIGDNGAGTLNILNSGVIDVKSETYINQYFTGSGVINFDNGTLNTGGLWASPADLRGVGTINTKGLVSDVDLVFDATNGLQQSIPLNSLPGQNIALNLDTASPYNNYTTLGVGYRGTGTLSITDGRVISSAIGYLGYHLGSTGTATVTGPGSQWNNKYINNTYPLYIGFYGTGTLNIESGSVVRNRNGYLGFSAGSTGTATVNGNSSRWYNTDGNLYVGNSGSGTLNIVNGGVVSNDEGYIGNNADSTGVVTVNGVGSLWDNIDSNLYVGHAGNGTLNVLNGGVVRDIVGQIGNEPGSIGTVDVSGAGSLWNSSSTLYIGVSGSGRLSISNGGLVSNSLGRLGFYSGSTGTVTVNGAGSIWNMTNSLYVGNYGAGTLNIENGGVVNNISGFLGQNTGSTGTVTVNGVGSRWNNTTLRVGEDGAGTLNIVNGGLVDVASTTYLAQQSVINFDNGTLNTGGLWASSHDLFGNGTINTKGLISDIDLVFDAASGLQKSISLNSLPGQDITINLNASTPFSYGNLGAGYRSTGSLTIPDGLSVFSSIGYLGYYSGATGTATATGIGSQWNTTNSMYVGLSGAGILNIDNAGKVNNYGGYLGYYAGSTGTSTVSGTGSQWINNSSLYVGYEGEGTLNIDNAGAVSSGRSYVAYKTYSTGAANVTGPGSAWSIGSTLDIGGSADGPGGIGVLNVTNGAQVHIGNQLKIWYGSTVQGDGTIIAPSTSNAGTFEPGDDVGTLVLDGDYTQEPTGKLAIELAGNLDFDQLDVTGDVMLGGTLQVSVLGGFVPSIGGSFDIVSSGGLLSDVFDTILLPNMPGVSFRVTYTPKIVTLNAHLTGDLTGDGFVGIADLGYVLGNWNQTVTAWDWASGDTNGDGYVGIADLNAVLGNWNAGTPPTGTDAFSQVPEPGPGTILVILTSVVAADHRFSRNREDQL